MGRVTVGYTPHPRIQKRVDAAPYSLARYLTVFSNKEVLEISLRFKVEFSRGIEESHESFMKGKRLHANQDFIMHYVVGRHTLAIIKTQRMGIMMLPS